MAVAVSLPGMNFKEIIKSQKGSFAAEALLAFILIAAVGIGGAIAVNYFFEKTDQQFESFNSCVKATGDAVECEKLYPQQSNKPETEKEPIAETPSAGAPKLIKELCDEKSSYYKFNQEGCDAQFPSLAPVKPEEPSGVKVE